MATLLMPLLENVFFCYDKTVKLAFLISIENFYLVEKQNKEKFVKKFVDSGFVKTCDELDQKDFLQYPG